MLAPGPPPHQPELPQQQNDDERVREMLERSPLYRPVKYRTLGSIRLPLRIEMFCASGDCSKRQLHDIQRDSTLEHALYLCRNCGAGAHKFLLVWDRYHEREERNSPVGVHSVYYEVGTVMKAGQNPPIEDRLAPALEKRLGEPLSGYYRTALRLRNFGLGIGSLAYLRRVVEEMASELLDVIAEECALGNMTGIDPAMLRNAKESRTFDSKMEFAKTILPARLMPGGHNPIDRLHDVASAGLHGEPEDECIRLFDEARPVFEFFFAELPERIKKEKEFIKQLSDLGRPASV